MSVVLSIVGTARVGAPGRTTRVTATSASTQPVRTSLSAVRTRVSCVGLSKLNVPTGIGMAYHRGSLQVTRAKKNKKATPEPVEEEEEEEEEFEDDEDDEGNDLEDAEEDEFEETDGEFAEEDEEAVEQKDAAELLPKKTNKSGKKKTVVVEEETGAFGTAVGYVQDAVANPAVRNLGILGASILVGSFALSAYNVYMRYNSNKSKRKRQVNKNVVVVERLRDFFPENRDSLNKGHIKGLQGKTGFKPEEIFRKYCRYKLNEEPFTNDFVADVLALKVACELDGETMKSVLLETGERIVKKYGILMRDVSDMGSDKGVQRKIDGCSMFVKVMYLADLDEFVPQAQGAEVQQKLKEIFGATDEDYEKLRITALGSADVSVLEAMITAKTDEGDEKGGAATPA